MAKLNILRDALRKNRIGLLKKEELARVFSRVEEKLTAYVDNFETFRYQLRTFEATRLEQYQELIFAIHNNNQKDNYKAVVELVSKAKEVRREIDESLGVITLYTQAKGLLDLLKAEVNASTLHRMPTIKILENTLSESENLMKEGKYQQAKVVITFCSLETKDLKEEKHEIKDFPEILATIEDLKTICSESQSYSKKNADPPLEIEGRIEMVLHSLLEDGQSSLVRKLLDDLQILLGKRKTFRDLYNSTSEDVKEKLSKMLTAVIAKDGWAGGSNFILSQRMESFVGSLKITEEKLDQAQLK